MVFSKWSLPVLHLRSVKFWTDFCRFEILELARTCRPPRSSESASTSNCSVKGQYCATEKVSRYHHRITIGPNRFRRRIIQLCFHAIFYEGFVIQIQEYLGKISWNSNSVEIRMLAQKLFSPIVHTSVQTWINVT